MNEKKLKRALKKVSVLSKTSLMNTNSNSWRRQIEGALFEDLVYGFKKMTDEKWRNQGSSCYLGKQQSK